MENVKSVSTGLGFGPVLFIVFLVLKLTNVITWSWWWVFSPLWLPVVIVLGLSGIVLGVLLIKALIKKNMQNGKA